MLILLVIIVAPFNVFQSLVICKEEYYDELMILWRVVWCCTAVYIKHDNKTEHQDNGGAKF